MGRRSRALWAAPLPLAGVLVSVAGALVLVPVGPGGHAVALRTADPTVVEAPVVDGRLRAPHLALSVAESCIILLFFTRINIFST